jgi:hypothetical protein
MMLPAASMIGEMATDTVSGLPSLLSRSASYGSTRSPIATRRSIVDSAIRALSGMTISNCRPRTSCRLKP